MKSLIAIILIIGFGHEIPAQDSTNQDFKHLKKLQKKADSLRQVGLFDEAITLHNEIYRQSFKDSLYFDGIEAISHSSSCYWQRGMLKKADSINLIVENLAGMYLNDPTKVYYSHLFNIASVHLFRGKFDSSRMFYKKAYHYHLVHEIVRPQHEINILYNLGAAYYYEGDLDSASYYFSFSFSKERTHFLENGLDTLSLRFAEQHSSLSAIYLQKGNYKRAIELTERALKIHQLLEPSSIELGRQFTSYGYILARTGAYEQAVPYMEFGIQMQNENGAFDNSYNITDISLVAEVYTWLKDFRKADSTMNIYFEHLSKAERNPRLQRAGYLTKGFILYEQRKYREAIPFFEKTIESVDLGNVDERKIAAAYNNLFFCLLEVGAEGKALEVFGKANAITLESFGKQSSFWMGLQSRYVEYLIQKNKDAEAIKVLKSIMEENLISDSSGAKLFYVDPWYQVTALHFLTNVYNKSLDPDTLSMGMEHFYELDAEVNNLRFSFLDYKDRVRISDSLNHIYDDALNFSTQNTSKNSVENSLKNTFYFMERSKAFNLFQELKTNDIQELNAIPTDVTTARNETESDINYYRQELLRAKREGNSSRFSFFQGKLSSLSFKRDQINSLLKEKYSDQFELLDNSQIVGLSQIKEELGKDEVILSYSIARDQLFGLYISADTAYTSNLGSASEIDSLAYTFRKLCSDRNSSLDGFKKVSFSLFQRLIDPFSLPNSIGRLLLVPDEKLFTFPFEALVTSTDGSSFKDLDYLLGNFEVRYSQSLTLLNYLNVKSASQNKSVLAMAPRFDGQFEQELSFAERSGLVAIPHTEMEVENISTFFSTKKLIGNDATEESLTRDIHNYGIIHLATHGLLNDKEPLNSKILFQKSQTDTLSDGMLHSFEILNMNIDAEMVVLSACNTGVGKINKGEGVQSIASSFFYSGARSVVMSQWPANDQSTSIIMSSFYENLSKGSAKSTALRLAKLDYLSSAPKLASHPYYWSQFVLYGKNDPIGFDRSSLLNPLLWFLGLAGVIALVAIVIKRKHLPSNERQTQLFK